MPEFARLGEITFGLIASPGGMKESQGYGYAEHAVIEGKPHLQYIGDGLQVMTLRLHLHASFCDPLQEYKKLRAVASSYAPLPFALANGEYKGRYVIEEISSDVRQAFGDGTLMEMDVEVRLREWVEDKVVKTKKVKARAEAKKKDAGAAAGGGSPDGVPARRIVRQQ